MPVSIGSPERPEYMKYKVAAVKYDPVMFEKERNIAGLYALAEEAARNGAKLIALTEMGSTGYCWYSRAELEPFVEPVPGPTTERFGRIAREHACWIVVGMPEIDQHTGIYYNAAVLIGPGGVVGVHRKSHLFMGDPKWAVQGDADHQVFPTPIGNIAMLVCMDSFFIETARIQGLRGADVIVLPSNWLGEKTPSPYWQTRAFDNGCYVLACDRIGQERSIRFSGGSVLINPDGTIDAYIEEERSIMYGEVDIAKARRKTFAHGGNKFLERRPKAYMDLMHAPYLWNPLKYFKLYGNDPLPAGKKSRIAVAQLAPLPGRTDANIALITDKTAEAAAQECELVVFPELTLTGLPHDAEHAAALAETAPGPSLDRLIDTAMKHNIHMVVGLIERDCDNAYNTAVLIGPKGMIGKYRKMHIDERDKTWGFTPGDLGFPHFNTPVGRIGLLIGHDAMFPESCRVSALNGVDLICCPSAVAAPRPYGLTTTGGVYNPVHWHLWRIRGGENGCYMAFANMPGAGSSGSGDADNASCCGRSGIFQPDTFISSKEEVTLSEHEEELGVCFIDTTSLQGAAYPTNPVRSKDYMGMRLPHWYGPIIAEQPPVLELLTRKH